MANALFSIKPVYVEKIFDGTKRFEFRKTFCKQPIEHIVIYETVPICRIVGEVSVFNTIHLPPERLWDVTFPFGGVERHGFDSYFSKSATGIAYALSDPILYKNSIKITDVGIKTAPQSFCYLSEDIYYKIRDLTNN